LGRLGIYGDALEENTSAGVIKNIRGATAFLDGHSHKLYSMDSPDKDSKNVKLAQAGTKLNNIGVLIIHENGTISQENVDKVPYDSDFADQTLNVTRSKQECYVDKEMNEYIEGLINEYSDQLKRVIGKSSFLLLYILLLLIQVVLINI
jgi:2',3'-cyclic-nucleotide 2'-phosphodiesterase (5'-nucleotidase family)